MLQVALRWTSVPSWLLHAAETVLSSGRVGLLWVVCVCILTIRSQAILRWKIGHSIGPIRVGSYLVSISFFLLLITPRFPRSRVSRSSSIPRARLPRLAERDDWGGVRVYGY